MVSFGFYHKPTTITLKEFQILSKLGFDDLGFISEHFHSDYYVFSRDKFNSLSRNTEKKVINVCRFLEVDSVVMPGQNSLLDTNLKADAVLIHGEFATFFQAKSSLRNMLSYQENYGGRQLDPYYSKRQCSYNHLPKVQRKYLAPGAVYLDVTQGTYSLSTFLWEFSKWLNIPINEEYKTLLRILLRSEKPLAIRTLEKVLHSKEIVSQIGQLKTIYPITFQEGYVQLKQREKIR